MTDDFYGTIHSVDRGGLQGAGGGFSLACRTVRPRPDGGESLTTFFRAVVIDTGGRTKEEQRALVRELTLYGKMGAPVAVRGHDGPARLISRGVSVTQSDLVADQILILKPPCWEDHVERQPVSRFRSHAWFEFLAHHPDKAYRLLTRCPGSVQATEAQIIRLCSSPMPLLRVMGTLLSAEQPQAARPDGSMEHGHSGSTFPR